MEMKVRLQVLVAQWLENLTGFMEVVDSTPTWNSENLFSGSLIRCHVTIIYIIHSRGIQRDFLGYA